MKAKVCKVENCEGKHYSKGYCRKHYIQFKRYGETLAPVKEAKICSVDGCEGKHYSKGYCQRHYRQYKKYGEALAPIKQTVCSVDGCNNEHYSKSYCLRHYHQIIQNGKILERTIFDLNEIIEYEDYAEIIIYNRQHEEIARALIDLEDVDKVSKYKWCLGRGYIYNKKIGALHRFLMGCPSDKVIDHINHNPLDNRKSNLRICTAQQNNMNKSKQKGNYSSQYKGVYFNKQRNKWVVHISINNKHKYIGLYDTELEASIEYDKKALLYHGIYCKLNHSIENYIDYILELGLDINDFDID